MSEINTKKIILFYPSTGIDVLHASVFMPLSVLFLNAALDKECFDTELIDQRVDLNWETKLKDAVSNEPLFVGISAMTGAQIRWGLKASEITRRINPDIPIIWGGMHASILPFQTLEDPRVDAVATGYGEKKVVEIAQTLSEGNYEKVMGNIITGFNTASCPRNKFKQPELNYSKIKWEKYVTPVMNGVKGIAHLSSRGCPHKCTYCYNQGVNNSSWLSESAETVVHDLKRICQLGCQGILFFDDNFFVNKKRVEDIARGIIDAGLDLKIKADCRVDYLLGYDSTFMDLLKMAGIEMLYIGAESGSDKILNMVGKNITVSDIIEVNHMLADKEIQPHYSFMAGLPGSTVDDIHDTVRLMSTIKNDNPNALVSPIKNFVPYPGTELFDRTVSMGFSAPDSLEAWSRYDWNRTPNPWLTKKQSIAVEKSIYVTMGLDFQLFKSAGISNNSFILFLFGLFSRLCVARARKNDLGKIPELKFFRAWNYMKYKLYV